VKHEIILSQWDWSCGDGCCDDYGTELFVNGNSVTRYFNGSVDSLQLIFDALGIDVDIKIEQDEYSRENLPPEDGFYEDDEEF
jgi:hypothetical protein